MTCICGHPHTRDPESRGGECTAPGCYCPSYYPEVTDVAPLAVVKCPQCGLDKWARFDGTVEPCFTCRGGN